MDPLFPGGFSGECSKEEQAMLRKRLVRQARWDKAQAIDMFTAMKQLNTERFVPRGVDGVWHDPDSVAAPDGTNETL